MVHLLMGERRGLNPRVVDSQSTALIHLATSAPLLFRNYKKFRLYHSSLFLSYLISEIQILVGKLQSFFMLRIRTLQKIEKNITYINYKQISLVQNKRISTEQKYDTQS